MKKQALVMMALALGVGHQAAWAQYPTVPKDVQEAAKEMEKKAWAHSDSAWAVAYPIIEKEAREGRPYIPWAARPTDLPQAKIPSFPGAEGGGMYSFGGRGGKVLTVTNLNDDGPGSFRWACEQGGARIIVFNVSGIIKLNSPVIIRAPYLTIAGQTAPGDGVCISGETVWVNTHDVVVRHMRFRRGETWVGRRDDTFGGNPVGNIMLDHLSCSYGLDENISFYRHMYQAGPTYPEQKLPTVNVTIQNTISAKGLDTYNHAFGSTLGGENCAFVRNLWASNTGRNPSIGWNGIFNFVNNVVFNWVHRSVDGGDWSALYNIYNNYFKPGPASKLTDPVGHRFLKPEAGLSRNEKKTYGRVYCEGNIMEGNDSVTADNWKGVQTENLDGPGDYYPYMRWNEPFPHPYYTVMSAKEAYDFVLDNVGATLPIRDELDQHIIQEVRTGEPYYVKDAQPDTIQFKHRRLPKDSWTVGIISDPQQMGGLPKYKKYKPYKDSDGDGMPDDWEKANGLNPNDPSDANQDCTGDGYTNIEKYINGISTKEKVDWTDLKNNHDTLAGKKHL
ncbi:MAG: thrombospondin type 3 repeat-containing protein [Prevotellaceae bacterium]|nr:thrombospondin type 3 repeat-containing protein [Prevotellaceae bacterium]